MSKEKKFRFVPNRKGRKHFDLGDEITDTGFKAAAVLTKVLGKNVSKYGICVANEPAKVGDIQPVYMSPDPERPYLAAGKDGVTIGYIRLVC